VHAGSPDFDFTRGPGLDPRKHGFSAPLHGLQGRRALSAWGAAPPAPWHQLCTRKRSLCRRIRPQCRHHEQAPQRAAKRSSASLSRFCGERDNGRRFSLSASSWTRTTLSAIPPCASLVLSSCA